MSKVKLVMPKFVSYSGGTGEFRGMPMPKLVVGDKEFKVTRTDYEYQGAMEVTIMVYANDLEIIGEEDENKRTD